MPVDIFLLDSLPAIPRTMVMAAMGPGGMVLPGAITNPGPITAITTRLPTIMPLNMRPDMHPDITDTAIGVGAITDPDTTTGANTATIMGRAMLITATIMDTRTTTDPLTLFAINCACTSKAHRSAYKRCAANQ